jgi:hypothetical protein
LLDCYCFEGGWISFFLPFCDNSKPHFPLSRTVRFWVYHLDLNEFNYPQKCTAQLRGKWGLELSQNGHLDLDAFFLHQEKTAIISTIKGSNFSIFTALLLLSWPIVCKKVISIYSTISDNAVFPLMYYGHKYVTGCE